MSSLYQKYRPANLAQYMGDVKVPQNARAFLLAGPSGCGKTTLARIIAEERGLKIMEVNSADNRGIDTARELSQYCMYRPIGQIGYAIILDEAHMMTAAGQNAFLKYLEDVPEWINWFICTTEPAKLIEAFKQRLVKISIKRPNDDEMKMIVKRAARGEGFKITPEQLDLLANCPSPRAALVQLEKLIAGNEVDTEFDDEPAELKDLAQAMLKGDVKKIRTWISENRKNQDAEGARKMLLGYMTAVQTRNPNKAAIKWLDLLCQADCWRNGWAALVVATELYFQ